MNELNRNASRGLDRRGFLRAGAGALLGGAAGLTLGSRRLVQAASLAGFGPPGDYRALVCVYLVGGNDSTNLVIPSSASGYAQYQAARGDLAVPQGELLGVGSIGSPVQEVGFHPKLPLLRQRFLSGDLALVTNVGTLNAPTTKADVLAKAAHLPMHLYSHVDQERLWQSPSANAAGPKGWGGLVAEALGDANPPSALPMGLSFAGTNQWQTGAASGPYSLSAGGSASLIGFDFGPQDQARYEAFEELLGSQHGAKMSKTYAERMQRAIEFESQVSSALGSAPNLATPFPNDNPLGDELRTIARLASQHASLGVTRQVFYCAMGGFDTHSGHLTDQPQLFEALDDALAAFQNALEELGLSNAVTTFTASEFGRTLSTNGQGSDHGWGGNQLVMGGAVSGGAAYGTWPSLELDGPDDAGYGRLIPTTSVDQLAATLSRWLGLSEPQLAQLFPNLGAFASSDLGFFA